MSPDTVVKELPSLSLIAGKKALPRQDLLPNFECPLLLEQPEEVVIEAHANAILHELERWIIVLCSHDHITALFDFLERSGGSGPSEQRHEQDHTEAGKDGDKRAPITLESFQNHDFLLIGRQAARESRGHRFFL